MNLAIKTTQLTRKFAKLTAVDSLNLQVPTGTMYGFLGPNGAGKTTTMRMLVGLLRPTSGTVELAGQDIQTDPIQSKKKIGYLAQNPFLYDKLTGREFLRFVGGLHQMGTGKIDQRTDDLISLLQFEEKIDTLVEGYSGGMRQKLGLCAALLHQPPVLVLDEPLAGLDPYSARLIKDLLRTLCDQGSTVFLSTHILEVAERVCDQVAILHRGRLVAEGDLSTLRQQVQAETDSTLEDLFLQLTAGDKAAEMAQALEESA